MLANMTPMHKHRELVFPLLQTQSQHKCDCADLAALSSSLAKASSSAAVVVSLLITACHTSLTASWNVVDLAWCLYSHAHAHGLVISMEAQDGMWQGQTGRHCTLHFWTYTSQTAAMFWPQALRVLTYMHMLRDIA